MRPNGSPGIIIGPSDGLDDGAAPVANCNGGRKDGPADIAVGPKSDAKRCHYVPGFEVLC